MLGIGRSMDITHTVCEQYMTRIQNFNKGLANPVPESEQTCKPSTTVHTRLSQVVHGISSMSIKELTIKADLKVSDFIRPIHPSSYP